MYVIYNYKHFIQNPNPVCYKMAVRKSNILLVKDIIYKVNEYIEYENPLLVCNKYLYNLKLKHYKLNKKYSFKLFLTFDCRTICNFEKNKIQIK